MLLTKSDDPPNQSPPGELSRCPVHMPEVGLGYGRLGFTCTGSLKGLLGGSFQGSFKGPFQGSLSPGKFLAGWGLEFTVVPFRGYLIGFYI